MVRGITFDQQLVRSKDMAHFMWQSYGKKHGVTKGCTMTKDASHIYLAAGYFLIYGRLIEISGTETINIPTVSSGTQYCYLVFEIDLSKTNTESSFLQGAFKILQSGGTYPTLVRQDLDANPTTGKYQLPFASFTIKQNGVGNWKDIRPVFTSTAIVEFPANGWSNSAPYTQTVHSDDIIGTTAPGYDVYIADGTSASDGAAQADAFSCVNKMVTNVNGNVTLYCYVDKPGSTFSIQIKE